ncbi:MAG TPA: Mu transposase C-terminal domain-containing protein [Pyrinomonadaceae bacterium]|nr:Mu transposase C-terminal domain-containing protein [Pyrinomonadaceae bacterium]
MAIASAKTGKTGNWVTRDSGRRSRNGKPIREILLSSLPADLQRRYAESRRTIIDAEELGPVSSDTKFSSTAKSDDIESRLTQTLMSYPADVREAMLNEARRLAEIVKRYNAIEVKRRRVSQAVAATGSSPVGGSPAVPQLAEDHAPEDAPFDSSASSGYEFVPEVLALCAEAICTDQKIIEYYKSKQHAVRKGTDPAKGRKAPSPYTLDRWSRRLYSHGLLTFLRSPSGDCTDSRKKQDRRRAVIDAEAIEWVNSTYKNFATPRSLFNALVKQKAKRGWKNIPSRTYVYRYWNNLPKIVRLTLERGKKAYTDQCAPYVPRDNRDLEALQVLCGDHSQRDVTVRLPDGSLVRPWLTLWFCLRTGLIWGWHLDLTPSSRTAGLAYANGVRTFGAQPPARPEEDFYSYIYTDHGKDYKSHSITGQEITFKRAMAIEGGLQVLCEQRRVGLIDDMGIKQILSSPYNAREKPVERVHRDISAWEQDTFETEYCGRDAKSKPDRWYDAYARHKRLLKRAKGGNTLLLDDSPFMTLDDYREALAGWIHEYNSIAHERIALGGAKVVPLDEYRRLYTVHHEIREDALAFFLMKPDKKKVSKNGVWMFQRHWWFWHDELSYYKGDEVEVRYTDTDYSQVWIATPGRSDRPSVIVQAQLVTPSAILNPNKETLGMVKAMKASDNRVRKEFNFITQSQIRGESVEDRVAALIEPEEEAEAIAVNDGSPPYSPARVTRVTRFDRPKLRSVKSRTVTADEVSSIAADEGIFSDDSDARGRVTEFDFDE